jgi:hypothetical protein
MVVDYCYSDSVTEFSWHFGHGLIHIFRSGGTSDCQNSWRKAEFECTITYEHS